MIHSADPHLFHRETNMNMIKHQVINVIQFLSFEDTGSFSPVLKQMGYDICVFQAGVDDLSTILQEKDPLIILGGPISAYDLITYPYLKEIIVGLKQRLITNYATFGICLGAQLIATALGARVYPGHIKEIRWGRLSLSAQAFASPLRFLEGIHILHWHGDTFDLPTVGTHLASSIYYPNQAFSVGNNIIALQFHAEADPKQFERWLIGHTDELKQHKIDILDLRLENQYYGNILADKAKLVLEDWLNNLIRF